MTNPKFATVLLSSIVALVSAAPGRPARDELVAYPEGFRLWSHVHSGVIGPANPAYAHFGGMHHIYANALAMKGYRDGAFPNGSVLVFDVFNVSIEKDVTTQTTRKIVDVMEKDTTRFAATGGWGYEEFAGDTHDRHDAVRAECARCHMKGRDNDRVFSKYTP